LVAPALDDLKQLKDQFQFEGGVRMEKKVLNAMKKAGKPVRPGDVAKMIGEDSKQVSKAINELKKQGKVVSPKRCYYAPA
jgi:biotin operon repressor